MEGVSLEWIERVIGFQTPPPPKKGGAMAWLTAWNITEAGTIYVAMALKAS